jgi:hypothetical protein
MEPVAVGSTNTVRRSPKIIVVVALGTLLCCGAYLCFLAVKRPLAPPTIVVSECKVSSADMQRMRVGDNFAFMATTNTLICKGQMDDTPPFTQRFCLKAENSKSVLTISLHEAEGFGGAPVDPMIVFSEYSERRHVVDATGRVIGEDYWGYLDPEKRWRKIHLEGVRANYGPVTKSEAQNYDRILSSACFSAP